MNETWKKNALALLDEAYIQPEYKDTWFKDNDPQSSIIPSLSCLTAEEASRMPACGRNPAAGHAKHLADSLEAAIRAFRGGPYECDWEASWRFPQPLSDEAWRELQARLSQAYQDVRGLIEANDDWEDPIRSMSVLALLAHAAYHLGAIRQIVADKVPHES